MGDVLDRWRLSRGWNVHDDDTQMAAIASIVADLDRHQIPHEAYSALYGRFIDRRAAAHAAGKSLPDFGADVLIAMWLEPGGLKWSWGKTNAPQLKTDAQNRCLQCFGTGMAQVYAADGTLIGVKPNCSHDEISDAPMVGIDEYDLSELEARLAYTPAETSIEFCQRFIAELTHRIITAARGEDVSELRAGLRTWMRIAAYCREHDIEVPN